MFQFNTSLLEMKYIKAKNCRFYSINSYGLQIEIFQLIFNFIKSVFTERCSRDI